MSSAGDRNSSWRKPLQGFRKVYAVLIVKPAIWSAADEKRGYHKHLPCVTLTSMPVPAELPSRDTMLLTDDFGKTIQHCQSAAIKDHMTTVNCQNAKLNCYDGILFWRKNTGFHKHLPCVLWLPCLLQQSFPHCRATFIRNFYLQLLLHKISAEIENTWVLFLGGGYFFNKNPFSRKKGLWNVSGIN